MQYAGRKGKCNCRTVRRAHGGNQFQSGGGVQDGEGPGASKVYGMVHGIQGLLQERYVDLSEHIKNELDIELLKRTPSAYLGSCRFKLPDISEDREIYDRIFEILNRLEIEYFFYIGGF